MGIPRPLKFKKIQVMLEFRSRIVAVRSDLSSGLFIFSPATSNLFRAIPFSQQSLGARIPRFSWAGESLLSCPVIAVRSGPKSLGIVEVRRGGNPDRWIGRTKKNEIVYPVREEVYGSYQSLRAQVRIEQPRFQLYARDGDTALVVEERVQGEVLSLADMRNEFPTAFFDLAADLIESYRCSQVFSDSRKSQIASELTLKSGLPWTPSHGDLSADNVVVLTSGGYAVIDWDPLYLSWLPAHYDLFSLMVSSAVRADTEFRDEDVGKVEQLVRESPLAPHLMELLREISRSGISEPIDLVDLSWDWIQLRRAIRNNVSV